MIAIALIALCALPLMRPYAAVQMSHAAHNAQAHHMRLADLEILSIKEKLYNGTILWDHLALQNYKSISDHFDIQVNFEGSTLPKDGPPEYARILITLKPKEGSLDYKPIKYKFFATIQDKSKVRNSK
ncbi:MAG: hypothetical protein ACI9S8_000268 [Chlamydiales bacterium]|jgi:hypothetical protein